MDVLRQSHRGNCRSGGGNRSCDAAWIQLGAGAIRIVGRRWGRSDSQSHEERESDCGGERREAARGGGEKPGRGRCGGGGTAAPISSWGQRPLTGGRGPPRGGRR